LNDFFANASTDAQYLYLLVKHFPALLPKQENTLLIELVQAMNDDQINTIVSGFSSLALGAYQENSTGQSSLPFSLTEIMDKGKEQTITSSQFNYLKQDISPDAKQIRMNNPGKNPFFFQLSQSGFETSLPSTPISQGIEIYREYRDNDNNVITSTTLGNEIEVHLKIRSLNDSYLSNIAIEDLLPGGFEVVRDSVKTDNMDYVDIREDRVNFFGSLDPNVREIVYKIKATNAGTFTVPPAFAEAMYDPELKARGIAGTITVTPGQ
jgi:uncharacterized protein YfaS (alpha-2-macroglobulin family)